MSAIACELPSACRVLFTTRAEGNMSSVAGDGAEEGERARARLRHSIGVRQLLRGYQVHGAVVTRVSTMPAGERRPRPDAPADGQATVVPGLAAMVLVADCLPVALAADGAVAMVHAGWRGLAAGVLDEGVRAVKALADGGEVAAVIGPGAGSCCYQVGAEVHAALGSPRSGRGPIDLQALARERLRAAGVEHVEVVDACTICDERFFSHRREGARAGRQAGVAWLS